jgi:D-amino-acid dehydrogenase
MRRVVVIGAGVIGLSCAYELCRRGLEVTLLDKGNPGDACSRGNTGWIVRSFSGPLPAPGLTWTSLKWMASAESPLYIRPSTLPSIASWLWSFWGKCNENDYRSGLDAVARISEPTMQLFDDLEADSATGELHRSGLLCAFSRESALEASMKTFAAIAAHGIIQPQRLSGQEASDLEPALSSAVAGGILLDGERHVRPEAFNEALLERALNLGVELRSATEVCGQVREGGEVRAVIGANPAGSCDTTSDEPQRGQNESCRSSRSPVEGDAFVIAAGAWSGRLAERLDVRLPMQAGKGYSITIDDPEVRLERPVYFPERKIVTSPFNEALRIGGTMELSGINEDIDPRRIAAIRRGAEHFLPGCLDGDGESAWVGMRPLLPDGLPVIGIAPGYDNLYLASGHAMLGVTLAPVTAHAIADLVVDGHTRLPIEAFSAARFIV